MGNYKEAVPGQWKKQVCLCVIFLIQWNGNARNWKLNILLLIMYDFRERKHVNEVILYYSDSLPWLPSLSKLCKFSWVYLQLLGYMCALVIHMCTCEYESMKTALGIILRKASYLLWNHTPIGLELISSYIGCPMSPRKSPVSAAKTEITDMM